MPRLQQDPSKLFYMKKDIFPTHCVMFPRQTEPLGTSAVDCSLFASFYTTGKGIYILREGIGEGRVVGRRDCH